MGTLVATISPEWARQIKDRDTWEYNRFAVEEIGRDVDLHALGGLTVALARPEFYTHDEVTHVQHSRTAVSLARGNPALAFTTDDLHAAAIRSDESLHAQLAAQLAAFSKPTTEHGQNPLWFLPFKAIADIQEYTIISA